LAKSKDGEMRRSGEGEKEEINSMHRIFHDRTKI
jgi:hypothetical protein